MTRMAVVTRVDYRIPGRGRRATPSAMITFRKAEEYTKRDNQYDSFEIEIKLLGGQEWILVVPANVIPFLIDLQNGKDPQLLFHGNE